MSQTKIYKFIKIETQEGRLDWDVVNKKSGDLLGKIEYEANWRQFVLSPEPLTIWSSDCLRDVIDFMEGLNK